MPAKACAAQYVAMPQDEKPEWYNTIVRTCTTNSVQHIIACRVPMGWRERRFGRCADCLSDGWSEGETIHVVLQQSSMDASPHRHRASKCVDGKPPPATCLASGSVTLSTITATSRFSGPNESPLHASQETQLEPRKSHRRALVVAAPTKLCVQRLDASACTVMSPASLEQVDQRQHGRAQARFASPQAPRPRHA